MIRTALVAWVLASVPISIFIGTAFRIASPVPGWGNPTEANPHPLARVTSR